MASVVQLLFWQELQRRGIDAVTLACRLIWSIIEDMPEVTTALGTRYFGADHVS